MRASTLANRIFILVVFISFFSFPQEQSLNQKKKNSKTLFNHLTLDFSASYVSLNTKFDETQFTNRELIFEEKLNQGIQYSVNLYYELENNLMLGFRYSLMVGNHESAQLFNDGFLRDVFAQKKIHFLGPVVTYRKLSYDLKFSYEISYSFGFTSYLKFNSVENSNIKHTANTHGNELGLAIYYQLTKHLALGGYTGLNISSFKKYRVQSPEGVFHERFEDDGKSFLDRGYYGLSLRIKK